MRIVSLLPIALALTLVVACQTASESDQMTASVNMDQFDVRTSPWVSLHFFAFHAARAESGKDYGYRTVPLMQEDAALLDDPAVHAAFEPLAALYEPVLDNALFRGGLFAVLKQLREGPQGIEDSEIRSTFESFMPTYLEHFWPRHEVMAEAFASRLRSDLAVHGPALLAATADELDASWGEADYTAYVSAYANWAGAFSNDNLLFLSATDSVVAEHALEVFVHETAHGKPIGDSIRPAAEEALAAHGLEHDRFWHYLQFKATGEAARRVLGDDYVPYVRATGLAARDDARIWYDALDLIWDEHDSLSERALSAAAIVARDQ